MSIIRVLHLARSLFVVLLFAFSITPAARAQVPVNQYLSLIEDYQFEKLTEISTLEEQVGIGPFSRVILDDYILLSYSRWAVQPEADLQSPPLQLDIYEMKDTLGAFGMFSIWPSLLEEVSLKRLNLSVDNYSSVHGLIFWRGAYFFHLSDPDPGTNSNPSLFELAHTLVDAIPQLNVHPVTVIHLPKKGLIRESIRFYLGKSSFALNEDFPQALAAEIGFDKQIEVTLARYTDDGHELFLVGYPTAALAEHHFVRLQNALQDYFSTEGVYMKRSGIIVSIFFGPEARAQEILPKIHYLPTITWLYQKDPDLAEITRSNVTLFLGFLRQTSAFIAAFVFLSLGLGVTAGFARFGILKRFPQLLKKGDPIQLKLD
jgi:hypothetical protein